MQQIRPTTQERTRQILDDLEAVRENLLALSDDIGHSIDHNDAETLEEGVEFKRAYNQKMAAFDSLASELSQIVEQYTRLLGPTRRMADGNSIAVVVVCKLAVGYQG